MTEKDSFAERGRALEDEYFQKRDRELIEKMRKATAAEESRAGLSAKTGLTDPALVQQLQELGFTPDTVVLLPLVPLVQVAWAEGGVTESERALVLKLARSRGIAEGSAADRQLLRLARDQAVREGVRPGDAADRGDARRVTGRRRDDRRRAGALLRVDRRGVGRVLRHQPGRVGREADPGVDRRGTEDKKIGQRSARGSA